MNLDVLKRGDTPWELCRFRYDVYVKELNRQQKYANHDDQTIMDPLDSFSTNFVARDGNSIAACLRTSFCRDGDLGYYKEFYRIHEYFPSIDQVSIVTQFMISNRCRKYRIAQSLCEEVYEYGLTNQIHYCFIDCNDPLVPMFTKLGFTKLFRDFHYDYGSVNVMLLDLHDIQHLRSIQSPFTEIYEHLHMSSLQLLGTPS